MKSIWLELILETENCHSISEAANKLNISQPAASRMIVNAENELSTKLFERTTKNGGTQLTSAGRALLPHIEDAVKALKKLEDKAKKANSAIIRLGMSEDTWGASARSRIISAFYLEHPEAVLKISTYKNDKLINALMREEVDMIVFSWGNLFDEEPPKPYETLPVKVRMLGDRPISLAYGERHTPEGVENGQIPFEKLKDKTFIIHIDIKQREKEGVQRFFFLESCRRFGFDPKIDVVENAADIKQMMVASGPEVFLSSAPELLREYPGVEFAVISDCPYCARYFMVQNSTDRNPYLDELYRLVRSFF